MDTKLVQRNFCHNIRSNSKLMFSNRTALLSALLFLQAFTAVSCGSIILCGGVRGRFVCDDQDPAIFHICMGNNQYTMQCPGTLHFNVRTQTCDWPESVNCVLENQLRMVHTSSPTTKDRHEHLLETISSFSNKSGSDWHASVLMPKNAKHSKKRHPRYRLRVVHNSDNDVETLIPADEKVIAQVKSLSEELKTIDNYLEKLDSDKLEYMIEPYKSNLWRRGRYSKWYHDGQSKTTSKSPYKRPTTYSANPYTSTSVYSPSHYHRKVFKPRPRGGRKSTSLLDSSRSHFSSQRPVSASTRASTYSAWYNAPAAKNSDSTKPSRKSPYSDPDSNFVGNKEENQLEQGKRLTNKGEEESEKDNNDKNLRHWYTKTTNDLVSSKDTSRSGGSIFSPPASKASTQRHRTTHSFTRRFKPRPKSQKPTGRPNKSLTSKKETPEKVEDKEEPTVRQNTFSRRPTQKLFQHSRTPGRSKSWTQKADTASTADDSSSWWSRKSSVTTPVPPATTRTSKYVYRSPPRRFFQSTVTRSPRPVARSKTSDRSSKHTRSRHTTPSASTKWWSSTAKDEHSTQTPSKPRRRHGPRYKPRNRVARPNYYTRTPSDNFRLVPKDERSSSYMSLLKRESKHNHNDEQPINAPAAADRRFVLHGNFVKNYNRLHNPASQDRSFALHKSQNLGHGHTSINAPAALDKDFALHKSSKLDGVNGKFELHSQGKGSKGKEISAYKSPVEKYKRKRGKCSESWCKLPDCRCIGADVPGGFDPKEIPQMVMLTFDDSINFQNMRYYKQIFNGSLRNPNGCPVKSTFFVSGDNSNYDMVRQIHKKGHEIASHTLSHRNPTTWWAHAGYENWEKEVAGMREKLHKKSGVPIEEITGMRAPFLQVGGDAQFAMLKENKFRYDSSMVTGNLYVNKQPPLWPFTLDTPPDSTTCSLTPCPTRSYPGLWEVPLIRWYGSNKMACAMPDACTIGLGKKGSWKFIEDNFQRHYTTNRAPLGIFIHASWFARKDGNLEGLYEFLASLADKEDVWVVTVNQALDWIQRPVRLSALHALPTWAC